METLSKSIKSIKINSTKFIKSYIKNISGILGITSPFDYKLLFELWQLIDIDTDEFYFIKSIKNKIQKKYDISLSYLNTSLSKLAKKGVIIRVETSVYKFNPSYFFKKSELKKGVLLELKIGYEIE